MAGEINTVDDYAALTAQHMAQLAATLECMGVPREWIARGFERGTAEYRERVNVNRNGATPAPAGCEEGKALRRGGGLLIGRRPADHRSER